MMSPHLTYRPREGVIFGVVSGQSVRLATLRSQAGMDLRTWREVARSGDRVIDWFKVQELRTGVTAAALGHRLTVAENAKLEVYDWPGAYAQRFDGDDRAGAAGGLPHPRHRGRVIWVKLTTKAGFPGGGFHIHGPPPCGNPRCIVIAQQWDSLFEALRTARQASIVVEL